MKTIGNHVGSMGKCAIFTRLVEFIAYKQSGNSYYQGDKQLGMVVLLEFWEAKAGKSQV